MSDRLPIVIDPEYLVGRGSELKGQLPLSGFARLSESLVVDQGNVDISIAFGKEGDVKAIVGHITTELLLQCQSCLEPISLLVDKDFRLGIVRSDEHAGRLPSLYEPLLLNSEQIALSELIEDELILAVPDIPMHGNCQPEQLTFGKIDNDVQTESNPFAILAKLKSKEK
jgi:uncharacterized protein